MPGGIRLEQIQEYMRMQSEQDRKNRTITVEAENVQEGLKKASIELGIPLSGLEYEIITRGNAGTFGVGRTPWKISVYERSVQVKTSSEAADEAARDAEIQSEAAARPRDLPGEVYVRINGDGAYLRATKPQGKGPRATEIMAREKLSLRGVTDFDVVLVSRIVKHADGE